MKSIDFTPNVSLLRNQKFAERQDSVSPLG